MSQLLENRNILVMGIANDRSIAWGVAQQAHAMGANILISYAGENLKRRVEPLAQTINATMFDIDVSSDEAMEKGFDEIKTHLDGAQLHGLVHSIAFADREDLKGRFVETSRDGFLLAQNISAYSFLASAKFALPMFSNDASLVTMSYIGAVRALPGYNVMGVAKASLEATVRYLSTDLGKDGIRVNAISAGPIRTLAASGVPGFGDLKKQSDERTPLGRGVDPTEVGKASVFLLSHLSSGTTGQTIYVDAGFQAT